nr:golgin subfamily A member 6-like protein 2 [Penaeus vannamei]
MRDTNTAYNAKEDEKEEEIKKLEGQVKKARRDRQRGEREAGAEREGFNAQIAGLEERNASLQSHLEEESRKNLALTTQIAEKESELTQAEADHEKRVKNLKKREKRKEKEAAEDRGELESELKRRDKKIEDLKKKLRDQEEEKEVDPQSEEEDSLLKRMMRQVREQEEKMKDVLSAMEYFRLQEMEPPRDPEAPGAGEPSAVGGRRRVRGAAGSGDTPPAAARDGAKAAAGGGDKPRQATGRKGKARKAPEDDEPLSAAGRDERPEAAGTRERCGKGQTGRPRARRVSISSSHLGKREQVKGQAVCAKVAGLREQSEDAGSEKTRQMYTDDIVLLDLKTRTDSNNFAIILAMLRIYFISGQVDFMKWSSQILTTLIDTNIRKRDFMEQSSSLYTSATNNDGLAKHLEESVLGSTRRKLQAGLRREHHTLVQVSEIIACRYKNGE